MSKLVWMFVGLLMAGRALCFTHHSANGAEGKQLPHWIWAQPKLPDSETRISLANSFQLPRPPISASLKIAADFCFAKVFINDRPVLVVEPYCETIEIDAISWLRSGDNVMRIDCDSIAGPSAIAASLAVDSGQSMTCLITDADWDCRGRQPNASPSVSGREDLRTVDLGAVRSELWGIDRRSAKVAATENYEQWRRAVAGKQTEKFWTVPGFEITSLRAAEPDEGSWVSMAFDEQGRLTIAKEERGLLRMTLDNSKKSVTNVEILNNTLLECRGLLYAHGALYANANNTKGMYRLQDLDGDGSLENVRLLREFPGSVGHGRNDITVDSKGKIHAIHGDSVNLPAYEINDRTSPLRDRVRGSSPGQGYVVRTDRDGQQWEIFCSGLRNPFGISVNEYGDWFTYDADAEFDMGSPWYRPTRIVHLVSGADYGWRSVTGKWPPYFPDHPDNAMPTLDIGKGSPTAVLFAYKTHFPDTYRRALMILDWTYGRILAVHLAPRGAGYRASAETFLQGKPLNVTDLAVGPDGALYLITGGRKTQSALYRISYVGAGASEQNGSSERLVTNQQHEQDCLAHAAQARELRATLETLHLRGRIATAQELDFAWQHLDADDWTIRYAARTAIEHQAIDRWTDRALAETRANAAVEAALAIVRTADRKLAEPLIKRLLAMTPRKLTLSQLWGLCQCYSLIGNFAPSEVSASAQHIVSQLEQMTSTPLTNVVTHSRCGTSVKVQGELAVLFSNLQAHAAAVSAALPLLTQPEQEARLHGLYAARQSKSGWSEQSRRQYFRALNEGEDYLRGEGMNKFLTQIRDEALATLTEFEKQQLAELLNPRTTASDENLVPSKRPIFRQWQLSDLDSLLRESKHTPDIKNGERIFKEALCSACHRSGARGPAVGPDLTHISSRFSRRDILQSIIDPSQVVAENYRNLKVVTTDGRGIVGRVLMEGDYRSEKLRLAINPLRPTEIIELAKSDIESSEESSLSPMPSGLIDTFQAHEILDLLQYLDSASGL